LFQAVVNHGQKLLLFRPRLIYIRYSTVIGMYDIEKKRVHYYSHELYSRHKFYSSWLIVWQKE